MASNIFIDPCPSTSTAPDRPPYNAVPVHDHILPPGWSCKHDPKTNKFYFIQGQTTHLDPCRYHHFESKQSSARSSPIPSSPSRSIISKYSIASRPRISTVDGNIQQIYQQFPNVEESYINQLMKMYNNRENLVISALLSEGHARGNFILDEALFYKLKAAFPNVEPDIIRRMLIKNENKEHSTISSILNLFGLFNTTRYEYSKKPQLKLKYLKFSYPKVDEVVLLDLLFNNDYNVTKVMEHLKDCGHESEEVKVKFSKISETAVVKEATTKLNRLRPTSLAIKPKHHANLSEQEEIRKVLVSRNPTIDLVLINSALEASNYDIDLAAAFIVSMTPQDSEKYFRKTLVDKEKIPQTILVSRETQTGYNVEDLFGRYLIVTKLKPAEIIQKNDSSTWTGEDIILVQKPKKLAQGANKENRIGPLQSNRLEKRNLAIGPVVVPKGTDASLKVGPQEKFGTKLKPTGPQAVNRQGAKGKQVVRVKSSECSFFK